MRLGLHLSTFGPPGGAQRLGPALADVASAADEAGFTGDLAETERETRRLAALGVTVMHGPVRESWQRTGEFARMVEAVAAL